MPAPRSLEDATKLVLANREDIYASTLDGESHGDFEALNIKQSKGYRDFKKVFNAGDTTTSDYVKWICNMVDAGELGEEHSVASVQHPVDDTTIAVSARDVYAACQACGELDRDVTDHDKELDILVNISTETNDAARGVIQEIREPTADVSIPGVPFKLPIKLPIEIPIDPRKILPGADGESGIEAEPDSETESSFVECDGNYETDGTSADESQMQARLQQATDAAADAKAKNERVTEEYGADWARIQEEHSARVAKLTADKAQMKEAHIARVAQMKDAHTTRVAQLAEENSGLRQQLDSIKGKMGSQESVTRMTTLLPMKPAASMRDITRTRNANRRALANKLAAIKA